MTKEQQEEEFKRRFGDNPTFNEETCIELLKFCSEVEDITRWNEWRRENPEVMIILSEADLKGATLIDADLNRAILIKAHLEGAIMYKAQLYKAILTGAFLQGVDLGNAILEGADLNGANLGKASIDMQTNPYNSNRDFDDVVEKEKQACLNNANLKGAVLANANLQGADLIGAHLEKSSLLDKKTNLNNVNLEAADLSSAIFENADLSVANLKDARLIKTNLKNANLRNANLTGANLWEVNLEQAIFWYANLEDTSISGDKRKTELRGSNFTAAIVNGKTIIQKCEIDKETNFTMVSLDSAQIEPSLQVALKTNIRRFEWDKYFKKHSKPCLGKVLTAPMRLFWLLSDYGSSSVRIGLSILIATLFFTDVYLTLAKIGPGAFTLPDNQTLLIGSPFHDYIRGLCFAISTMVTLGFGGINIKIISGHNWLSTSAFGFVTLNLITGYLFLSVLVTRFGILFQSQAPEQKTHKTNNTILYLIVLILFTFGFSIVNKEQGIKDTFARIALFLMFLLVIYCRLKPFMLQRYRIIRYIKNLIWKFRSSYIIKRVPKAEKKK